MDEAKDSATPVVAAGPVEDKLEEKASAVDEKPKEKAEKTPKSRSSASARDRAAQISSIVTAASSSSQNATLPQYHITPTIQGATKYAQLLAVIDEMGKELRPTFTGNRNCGERLKKEIIHARVLIREVSSCPLSSVINVNYGRIYISVSA